MKKRLVVRLSVFLLILVIGNTYYVNKRLQHYRDVVGMFNMKIETVLDVFRIDIENSPTIKEIQNKLKKENISYTIEIDEQENAIIIASKYFNSDVINKINTIESVVFQGMVKDRIDSITIRLKEDSNIFEIMDVFRRAFGKSPDFIDDKYEEWTFFAPSIKNKKEQEKFVPKYYRVSFSKTKKINQIKFYYD